MVITRFQPISDLFPPVIEDMVPSGRRMAGTTRLPETDIPKAEQARRRRIEIRNGHARQIEAPASR